MRPLDVLERIAYDRGVEHVPLDLLEKARGATLPDVMEYMAWLWGVRNVPEQLHDRGYSSLAKQIIDAGFSLALLERRRDQALAECVGRGFEVLELDRGNLEQFDYMNERFRGRLRSIGLSKDDALVIAAAFTEMADNAREHAVTPIPAVAGYEVEDDVWRFCVTDVGIGVLESLKKNEEFSSLSSGTEALRLALTEGISASGSPGRGQGFSWIFKALSRRRALVRIRSSTGVAECTGFSPTRHQLTCGLRPHRQGLHVAVEGSAAAS